MYPSPQKIELIVHRRAGGLENTKYHHHKQRNVHRRAGGLEKQRHTTAVPQLVHRRAGGLESWYPCRWRHRSVEY